MDPQKPSSLQTKLGELHREGEGILTAAEKWLLSELRAKFGDDARLPDHDPLTCGIYWFATCISCLTKWEGTDRQKELPKILQSHLGFKRLEGRRR